MKTTIIQDDSNELKPEQSETREEVGVHRHPTNLSGRMGRWSAHHRKTAILGWLAFVVASFFVGSFVIGAKQATGTTGPGESGRALTILDDGFKQPASESVLVQSETLKTTAPEFVAATRAVLAALERQPAVVNIRSPLEPTNAGQVSADGRSALVDFQIRGDSDLAVVHRPGKHRRRRGTGQGRNPIETRGKEQK